MVELPEALMLAKQMNEIIVGKKVTKVNVENIKPKIFFLNVSIKEFKSKIEGHKISKVFCKGKWIYVKLDSKKIFSTAPEMGGDILYHTSDSDTYDNYHFKFIFEDETFLTIKYQGFIFARFGTMDELNAEKYPGNIGPTPLDKEFTLEKFSHLISESNTMIKSLLLDHQNLPGVANFYLNEAFFRSKIHPKRKALSLKDQEIKRLFDSIIETLQEALDLKGRTQRKDLHGAKGKFNRTIDSKSVGKGCPNCQTEIMKINVAGTNNYICPSCQDLG
ncbi:MAG: hypothetical protein KGD64_03780 [Candidatus Heimdallarchaeota archaeon]|nr:hypothetical protein [Candidatus Heimdallarchaeota archaeon]